jgi:hypothetical protein
MYRAPTVELWGGEAVEVEAKEGVGVGVETDLGVGGIGCVGRAGVGAGKTFFVDADVHGLDGAEGGIDQEGDGHGIEEGGRFLAPLVVEEGESVGERGALAEEEGALDLVELELGGVEGHDVEGDASGEEFPGGGDVVEDVPFGLRGRGRAEAEVAVAALDGAAHQDDAPELSESGGVFVDGGADVHQRADGDEGDLAGVAANLVEKEGDGVGVGGLGEMAGFGVAALGEVGFWRGGRASGYGDVGAADFGEEAVEELGAGFSVAEGGGDTDDLQFGAAQGQSEREGVVDVGVENYFFLEGGGGLGLAEGRGCQDCTSHDGEEQRPEFRHVRTLKLGWARSRLEQKNLLRKNWCGREDSNLHALRR